MLNNSKFRERSICNLVRMPEQVSVLSDKLKQRDQDQGPVAVVQQLKLVPELHPEQQNQSSSTGAVVLRPKPVQQRQELQRPQQLPQDTDEFQRQLEQGQIKLFIIKIIVSFFLGDYGRYPHRITRNYLSRIHQDLDFVRLLSSSGGSVAIVCS